MSPEHAPQRQRRAIRYLTKEDVRIRYGWASKISVDRSWQKYQTLPAPTTYRGRFPLWAEHILDAHDARAPREGSVVVSPELKEARAQILAHARAHRRHHQRQQKPRQRNSVVSHRG